MTEIAPPARPQITRAGVLAYVTDGQPLPPFPFLVGRRGYFANTMGRPGANDIGLYDDAIWLLERDRMTAWNANCDPTRFQTGMASLTVGRHLYRPGIHNLSKDPHEHPHYEALVQAAQVVVRREGTEHYAIGAQHATYGECVGRGLWRGFFGINVHCGGETTTSSLGCQTIPPEQWGDKHAPGRDAVMTLIHRALAREGRDASGANTLTYILTSRY